MKENREHGEGFDEQDRQRGAEICFQKTSGHQGRQGDRLTGPRQTTSPIDQNHRGFSLLIEQHGDLGSEGAAGDKKAEGVFRMHTSQGRGRKEELQENVKQ